LRSNGVVDRELYLRLREAYTFQAASTVDWVEVKLGVLLDRVDQGVSVSLFSPVSNDQVVVETRSAFEQWAEAVFPERSNDRSWPIADARAGRAAAGLVMSASDPKRTFGAAGSEDREWPD